MGDYAIQAAENTYQQALGVKMNAKVRADGDALAPQGRKFSCARAARSISTAPAAPALVPRRAFASRRPCPSWHSLPDHATVKVALCLDVRVPQIGVTPMIGKNDVETEIFDQAAARQVR